MISRSGQAGREKSWIIRKMLLKLVTSFEAVDFTKTLFTHKEAGEMSCLVDCILSLFPYARLAEDPEASLLIVAVQTSFRRGGEASTSADLVSKQVVKDCLYSLEILDKWKSGKQIFLIKAKSTDLFLLSATLHSCAAHF